MAARVRQGRTLSGDVHAQIRSDILSGALLPGERLRLAALCERFKVSLTVVREALTRVAEQGLVVSQPQIGFTVVSLDPDDLADLTAARVEIETWALRRSVERGDLSWETQVVATHHVLSNTAGLTADHRISEEWTIAHGSYHAALAAGCGSKRMLSIREHLYDASELYRRWSANSEAGERRDVAGEHRAIMNATLDRDADLACQLLSEHLHSTTRILLGSQALGAEMEAARIRTTNQWSGPPR